MFLDSVVIIILVFAFFKGFRKGLVVALFSFIGFFIGLAAAIKLSSIAAFYINESFTISQRWVPFIAFTLVFLLVVFLVRLGAKAIEGMLSAVTLGWVNRVGGVLFFSVLYLFIFSLFVFYAEQLHVIKEDTMQASVTFPFLKQLAPKMMSILGAVIPVFSNMFHDLMNFFEQAPSHTYSTKSFTVYI
jgi:membrane protein required for colicin V production